MFVAPQQNWKLYEAMTAESDAARQRSLTVQQKYELYCDMFNLMWAARSGPGNWERLDQWRWEEKLKLRRRMVEAFAKLDQLRNERAAANNAG